jgi:glyoxylase-like metal-dependent hydrolase (beta-lactamase superfamily II)
MKSWALVILGLLLSPLRGLAAEPILEEVAPGVWAALQESRQRFNDSNAVVLVGDDVVWVVDTQANPEWVQGLIAGIRALTDVPVRALVHTHWHGDHTQNDGLYAEAFGDSLEIIGHETLGEDIRERAIPQLREEADGLEARIVAAEERLEKGEARDGGALDAAGKQELAEQIEAARVVLAQRRQPHFREPTRHFSKRMVLRQGTRRVELLHFRGHTRGDVVVYLPAEKVLITGDIVDDLPYGGHGYPREWAQSLAAMEQLDFDRLIPGHGRIHEGKEHLRLVRRFFEAIVSQVAQAVAEGKSLEETQEAVDLGEFRTALVGDDEVAARNYDFFVPATIERAWLEARGELPD